MFLQVVLIFTAISSSCVAAHLAIVTEESLLDDTLIAKVFNRLINNNWKFPIFKDAPIGYQFVQANDSVEAIQKVCGSPGLSGLLVVGSCSFVNDLIKTGSSLGLPTVAVPNDLCDATAAPGNFSLTFKPSPRHFLMAALAVLKVNFGSLPPTKYSGGVAAEPVVAVFYDKFQDYKIIEEFLMTLSEQKIGSKAYQLDSEGRNLTTMIESKIKSAIRHCVVFGQPHNAVALLRAAQSAKALQINYFWIVIDTGIAPTVIEDLIPRNESANILIVTESVVKLSEEECDLVLSNCRTVSHQSFKLKIIEALMAFAAAMQNLSNSVGTSALVNSSSRNASCSHPIRWPWGTDIVSLMRLQRPAEKSDGAWLPGNYFLRTIATFQDAPTDPVKFVSTGRYYLSNSSLIIGFRYKDRLLAFPNTFIDFKGKHLRVCSVGSAPYTTYANGTFGTPSGISVELINYFAMHLNFTYTLFSPPDNQYGAPQSGSPYFTGCIGMVQKGEADFATPFAITTLRSQVIDYSESFMYSTNTILVKRPTAESKLWNVFTPFSWDSWALIVGMFFIAPLIIYAFARLSPFSAWSLQLPYSFADEIWLKEYVWSALGSFLQQGQDFYPFAMSPRSVMAFWWILTVILFASYTGDLTSKLAVTVAKYPIQSIDDLISKPHYTARVPRGTNIYAAFLGATEGPFVELKKQWSLVDTFDLCATNLVTKPDPYLACVSDLSISLYYANILCKDIYNADNYFNPYFMAMAFPQDSYYLPSVDFLLQRGKANGIVGFIVDKFVPRKTDCGSAVTTAAEAEAINSEGVGGAYIVSLSLYGCGLLILLVELAWVRVLRMDPLKFPGF